MSIFINGFDVDLIHRDSPLSPYYNNTISQNELVRSAALRSFNRECFFHSSMYFDKQDIASELSAYEGEYLMKIYVGSPPVEILAIADTGSHFTWIQCFPCDECYHQNGLFMQTVSSTYQQLLDHTEFCKVLNGKSQGWTNKCKYNVSYMDGSFSSGILSNDTFYIESSNGKMVFFEEIVFGCGHHNQGKFGSRTQGLVGLGRGPLSFINQIQTKIEPKFAYCLNPMGEPVASKFRLGAGAKINTQTFVSTPLIESYSHGYYITLESVSIGDHNITIVDQTFGDIMIDTGAMLTMLHSSIYTELEIAIKKVAGDNTRNDPTKILKLCYDADYIVGIDIPDIIFHFIGADLSLSLINTFVKYLDFYCLTIVPNDRRSILGSMAQVDFQVLYDVEKMDVSFAQAECSTF